MARDLRRTGSWDPRRRVDWIVIYKHGEQGLPKNELFMARPGDLEGPRDDRYLINLRDIRRVGHTEMNWPDFASAGANPIRYITRE